MNTPLRFVVLGTGAIAGKHIAAIAAVPDAKLVAVWGRDSQRGTAFAAKYGVEFVPEIARLVEREDIDCAMVATPSGAHGDGAIPFLKAGKPVLCEKPLDVSIGKMDAMVATAKAANTTLAAIFQMRLGRGAIAMKRAVTEGRFGRLTLCSAYLKWWRDAAYYDSVGWRGTRALDGGGALMNQGVHIVDLLQWIVGMPEEVFAFSGCLAHSGIEVEDTAVVALKYAHGGLGVIEAATSCKPGLSTRIEICGDRGSAIIDSDRITHWQFDEGAPWDADVEALKTGGRVTGSSDPGAVDSEGHRVLVQDFVSAVREKREPLIPGSEARNGVRVILAAYESAASGRPVRLA